MSFAILIWSLLIVLLHSSRILSHQPEVCLYLTHWSLCILAACVLIKSGAETVVFDACTYSVPTEVSLFYDIPVYDIMHSEHSCHQWINLQCRNSLKLHMFWLDTASFYENSFHKQEAYVLWMYSTRELIHDIVAVIVATSVCVYILDWILYI